MITFRYVATQDTLRLETCKTQKFKAADNHAHKQTYTQLIHNLYMSPQKKKKNSKHEVSRIGRRVLQRHEGADQIHEVYDEFRSKIHIE